MRKGIILSLAMVVLLGGGRMALSAKAVKKEAFQYTPNAPTVKDVLPEFKEKNLAYNKEAVKLLKEIKEILERQEAQSQELLTEMKNMTKAIKSTCRRK